MRLEARLIAVVGMGLLLCSLVAGVITYRISYLEQIGRADSLQGQLVAAVQEQADVAAFAANAEIAHGVLRGLVANHIILAGRIQAGDSFKIELGSRKEVSFDNAKSYILYSPVDRIERIGVLSLVKNEDEITRLAREAALYQTFLAFGQILITAIIVAAVLRAMVINPIVRLAKEMEGAHPGTSVRLTVDGKHANDEIGMLTRSTNALLDAAESAIREVEAQRSELQRLATHDHLTGLPTMRLANDRLQIACSNAQRSNEKVALLFIDLDGFKAVNDNHGHLVGDRVLKEVANRLKGTVRAGDTAARIGGDEFIVILPALQDAKVSVVVAENISATLAVPIVADDLEIVQGASIGIAIYPDHGKTVEDLRVQADAAMYAVKRRGKGSFSFAADGAEATPR